MDGAKKSLLVSAFALLLTGTVAATAGVISVPNFGQSIPTPAPSPAPAPGTNMAIPTLPNGSQVPTTTQPPSGVSALPPIVTSGQTTTPIYGNPTSASDSTGSGGGVQSLANNCAASGGSWNWGNNSCSSAAGISLASQCYAMGGSFNWASNQCQMVSLPGSGGSAGWVNGEYISFYGWGSVQVVASGGRMYVVDNRLPHPGRWYDVTNTTSIELPRNNGCGGNCDTSSLTTIGDIYTEYSCNPSGNSCPVSTTITPWTVP
jgi:hypothetical protein